MTVIQLHPNSDANVVLERNKDAYDAVFLLGWDTESELRIDTTDNWSPMEILWALEKAKQQLLMIGDVYDDE